MSGVYKILSNCYIARNFCQCYNCSAQTPAISVAAEKFEIVDEKEHQIIESSFTFFDTICDMSQEIKSVIRAKFPYFKPFYSNMAGIEYWANHCIYCGRAQGSFYLHAEPGGAFFPEEIEDCKNIELIQIPIKSSVEIEGSYSTNSNSQSLLQYARLIALGKI